MAGIVVVMILGLGVVALSVDGIIGIVLVVPLADSRHGSICHMRH